MVKTKSEVILPSKEPEKPEVSEEITEKKDDNKKEDLEMAKNTTKKTAK